MSAFTQEVRFRGAYDHRDEPGDQRGACGMIIELILRGPDGALSCQIMTDWMAHPLDEPYHRGQSTPRARRSKPGCDAGYHHGLLGAGVFMHCPTQLHDYWSGPTDCSILGVPCYGDMGYLASDAVVAALVAEGSDGAWREMRAIYDEWFAKAPA